MQPAKLASQRIDWPQCVLVEVNPEIQSGAPVLRGTRMPVSAIVDNFDYGVTVSEIAELFQISEEVIRKVLTYAKSHLAAPI
jgi:uncharacterized protein (DUF433 family)